MLSNIQEIIERSLYQAIIDVLVKYDYTPDPADYELDSSSPAILENANANYQAELINIRNQKGFSVEVFSFSGNQSKGTLKVPRIVIDTNFVSPGVLGDDTYPIYELVGGVYHKKKKTSISTDYSFTVFAVANNVKQLRVLVSVLLEALPRRGYIKTYLDPQISFSNNLFIKYMGSGDSPNLSEGVIEKYYSFEVNDIWETLPETLSTDISKITEITLNKIKLN